MRYFFLFCVPLLFTACNKSKDVNANNAFVAVTNVAPGSPAVTVFFNEKSLIPFGNLPYDSSTSMPGNAYPDSAVAGVHLLEVKDGSTDLISGLTAFQRGSSYSIFLYDSTATNDKLKPLIFQDNLVIPADSLCYLRFINFSPAPLDSLLSLYMINVTDTFHTFNDTVFTGYRTYAGNNVNPGDLAYNYLLIKAGLFHAEVLDTASIVIFADTTLNLLGGKSYTLYLQGNRGSTGMDSLKLKTLLHN
jgi:Domain of unknown function (DUF4397)